VADTKSNFTLRLFPYVFRYILTVQNDISQGFIEICRPTFFHLRTFCKNRFLTKKSRCSIWLSSKMEIIFPRQLIPWGTALPAKLIVTQLIEVTAFNGNQNLITVFTRAGHLSLSWTRRRQFKPSHSNPLSSTLEFVSHLCPYLPSGIFVSKFSLKYSTNMKPDSFHLVVCILWCSGQCWDSLRTGYVNLVFITFKLLTSNVSSKVIDLIWLLLPLALSSLLPHLFMTISF
jgi:hypothetical protein